ncbi:MAG: hypothetical protein WCQ20_04385 [Synechococcaceae cyanobacterium ELA739]
MNAAKVSPMAMDRAPAQDFFEVYWHGEAIGDGGDLQEALACYALVAPEDGDWQAACADPEAEPHIERHASFEAFLENEDALETITVSAAMIEESLPD